MAVTLYRQVGKGKARRYQKVNLGRGRRRSISPVPTSCGTRSLAPVRGNTSATTSMRQSPPASASRHISRLSMPTFQSSKTKTRLAGRPRGRVTQRSGPPAVARGRRIKRRIISRAQLGSRTYERTRTNQEVYYQPTGAQTQ